MGKKTKDDEGERQGLDTRLEGFSPSLSEGDAGYPGDAYLRESADAADAYLQASLDEGLSPAASDAGDASKARGALMGKRKGKHKKADAGDAYLDAAKRAGEISEWESIQIAGFVERMRESWPAMSDAEKSEAAFGWLEHPIRVLETTLEEHRKETPNEWVERIEQMISRGLEEAKQIGRMLYHVLELKSQAPGKASSRTVLPDALHGDLLSIPNAQAYHDARKALAQPGYFKRSDEEQWPTALFSHTRSSTKVQMKDFRADTPRITLEEETALVSQMWKQHADLSDTDADTLDALMAIYLERNPTAGGDAIAHVDQLLELRGVKRKASGSGRRGGYHAVLRNEELASVFRLESLWIEFDGPIVTQRGKRPVVDVIRSRAIAVSDVYGQRRLDDGRLDVLSFSYRPGKAFAHFLQSEGGRQTALLSTKALKYDVKYHAIEKRLARYFAYIWRVRASTSGLHQPFTVEALLAETGLEVEPKKPKRTKDRLETALDRLEKDGVIAAWENERDIDTSRRGWLEEWRRSSIKIDAPDQIRGHLRRIDRQHGRLKLDEGSLAARFASARKNAGKTQSYCADRLRITPTELDKIETGQITKLKPELSRKIEAELAELLSAQK